MNVVTYKLRAWHCKVMFILLFYENSHDDSKASLFSSEIVCLFPLFVGSNFFFRMSSCLFYVFIIEVMVYLPFSFSMNLKFWNIVFKVNFNTLTN